MEFHDIYKTFKLLYCNPDSRDVLEFMYVYDKVKNGVGLGIIEEEIQKNRELTGNAYPQNYNKDRK